MIIKYLLILALSIVTSPLWANDQTWKINLDHSELFVKTSYLTVSSVTGRFNNFSGTVRFSDDLSIPTHITIKIKAASIDTSNKMRDKHLRSHEFFQVERYPNVTFESSKIKIVGVNEFEATGDLHIIGVGQETTIKFSLGKILKDTWDYKARFVDFSSSIKRSDFGIEWNKTLAENKYLVGDKVDIWGTLQLQPQNKMTASSRHMIPDSPAMRMNEKVLRGEREQAKPEIIKEVNEAPKTLKEVGPATTEETVMKEESSKSFLWWCSYAILGTIGFFGILIIVFQGKYYLQMTFKNKYQEIGKLGFLTDIFVLILGFLYSWAMWHIVVS